MALVLLVSGGDAQVSEGGGIEEAPDNDPVIYEWEVVAPAIDSRDPAWQPAYEWHEGAESVDCGGRDACEDFKGNATGEAK